MTHPPLLDPKNDYVFKRLFANAPDLLRHLINDLRPNLPRITSVKVLNPEIQPAELKGKSIRLDIHAVDANQHHYNIEMQVRRHPFWGQRSIYYLARMLSEQMQQGEDYEILGTAIGIHLLDFDLFNADQQQQQQAIWRFELRDEQQPWVKLGNQLQFNLIELKKADRLGVEHTAMRAWIQCFEHWQEDEIMSNITHPPVQEALERLQDISANEQARWDALSREMALLDEKYFTKLARREGHAEGLEEGKLEAARALLAGGLLSEEQIAQTLGFTLEQIQEIKATGKGQS